MHTLKLIGATILHLVKQVWRLPEVLGLATEQRRRQVLRKEHEAERLDRLRHPSKYVGR